MDSDTKEQARGMSDTVNSMKTPYHNAKQRAFSRCNSGLSLHSMNDAIYQIDGIRVEIRTLRRQINAPITFFLFFISAVMVSVFVCSFIYVVSGPSPRISAAIVGLAFFLHFSGAFFSLAHEE